MPAAPSASRARRPARARAAGPTGPDGRPAFRRLPPPPEPGRGDSLNAWRGGDTARTPLGTKAKAAMPDATRKKDAFELCTEYAFEGGSRLVAPVMRVATAYLNYGLRFTGPDRKRPSPEVQEWLAPIEWKVRRWVQTAWHHFLVYQNVIPIWYTEEVARQIAEETETEPEPVLPLLARPEQCQYQDLWGQDELTWTPANSDGSNLPDIWTKRPGRNVLTPRDEDFHFDVFKYGPPGEGLDWPRLGEVFGPLWQLDCMDAGEAALAMSSRLLVRQHKMGFDKKYGASAGSTAFHYKKEKGEKVRQAWQQNEGVMDYTGNFDHDIVLAGLVDPRYYDARKYADVVNRVLDWVRPFGRLGLTPNTFPYLAAEAQCVASDRRSVFGPWLESVLNRSMNVPGYSEESGPALRLVWSHACFRDPRIAWEISKYAHGMGGLSQRTVVEDIAGHDDAAELDQKRTELTERESRVPLYDPNHNRTGAPTRPDAGGRPAGRQDPVGGAAA